MDQNETIQTILSRRSVRKYTAEPVSPEMIATLTECARFAPSGLNNQPWRFVVIDHSETIRQLSALTHSSEIVASAPVLIAVFLDTAASYHREKDFMAIGAAIENILLAAHSMQLGAVWLGEILKNKEKVSDILQAPNVFEPAAVIAVGHPNESDPGSAVRKLPGEIIFKNSFIQ